MASTGKMKRALAKPIKQFFEQQLVLRDLNPALIKYELIWPNSTIETEQDRIDSINACVEVGTMSIETSVSMLASWTQVPDVEEEIKRIQKQQETKMKMEEKKAERRSKKVGEGEAA